MNNIEILERLEQMQQTFREDGLQGYEMAIVTAKKLINNLIQENKELKEHLQKYYNGELYTAKQLKNIEENQRKYFIHKSKLKEIIYPTPENYIPLEVQTSEMYKKILNILEE